MATPDYSRDGGNAQLAEREDRAMEAREVTGLRSVLRAENAAEVARGGLAPSVEFAREAARAIAAAEFQITQCLASHATLTNDKDHYGATWGEMDWRTELNRLRVEQGLKPEWFKELNPFASMTTEQVKQEAILSHQQFNTLIQEYKGASSDRRHEICVSLRPIVAHGNELRAEYASRTAPEVAQEIGMGFGY